MYETLDIKSLHNAMVGGRDVNQSGTHAFSTNVPTSVRLAPQQRVTDRIELRSHPVAIRLLQDQMEIALRMSYWPTDFPSMTYSEHHVLIECIPCCWGVCMYL